MRGRASAAAGTATPPGPTTSTTRCAPSSPRSATATTPTSAGSRSWPRRFTARTSTTAATRRFAGGASARPPTTCPRALRRLLPGPRPGRQPRLRRPDARPRPGRWRPSARCSRRLSRCCSWARSTASRTRFSSSPTTSTRRSPWPPVRAGAREFAAFASFGGEVPDPEDPATLRALQAQPPAPTRRWRACTASCWPPAGGCRAAMSTRRPTTRTRAGCVVRRGPYELAMQLRLGPGPDTLPRGAAVELTAARDDPPELADGVLTLPADVRSIDPMTEVWPGRPFPLGAAWDGQGTNFSLFSEHAEGVELCLFDDDGEETRIDVTARRALNWHCYLPGRRPRPALRLPRPRPLRARRGPPLQPRQAADRSLRQGDRGHRRLGARRQHPALRAQRRRGRRLRARRRGRLATPCPSRVVIDEAFDWEGDRPPADPVRRHDHLRDPRQGLHDDPPRGARGAARHLRRPRLRAGDRLPQGPRGHRGRAAADPPHLRRVVPVRARACANYWGYSTIGFFAPYSEYAATGRRGEQVREFKGMVKALHQARHRGDPRRRLQPHRRGQPPRADAVLQGRRQRRLLPAGARRPAPLHGLHRHRQLAEPGPPERPADDHGLAALLRDRVPRRRLPLRPGLGAGPRALRRRPPVGVLRHDPPGPGPLPGQADRRAVGRRPGRLPGRQLPDPVVGVERRLPRLDARLLARVGERRRVRLPARRAPPTCTSPTAASRSPRSTSSPPTTASPCATSSPTTRSTTRPTTRTTRTAPTTTAPGTAASRARPTIPRSTSCAAASSATS